MSTVDPPQTGAPVPPASSEVTGRTELLQFPTDFPVKIMGVQADGFVDAVIAVVLRHAPDFDPATLEQRPSRQGTYLGLTATIRATSRAQLDGLYLELTAHPQVKVVL
ncbi:MAG: YbeD family protein [Burkholderiaceae bacterium]